MRDDQFQGRFARVVLGCVALAAGIDFGGASAAKNLQQAGVIMPGKIKTKFITECVCAHRDDAASAFGLHGAKNVG